MAAGPPDRTGTPLSGGERIVVDFAIEPEFQAKLDWMDLFVREKIQPL